jgi:hypothetical protein
MDLAPHCRESSQDAYVDISKYPLSPNLASISVTSITEIILSQRVKVFHCLYTQLSEGFSAQRVTWVVTASVSALGCDAARTPSKR